MKNKCPECLSYIYGDSKVCKCGWKLESNIKRDNNCHFNSGSRKCPLIGTMVEGVKNDKMLCRAHWHARNDLALSLAILNDIEKNPVQWFAKTKDWRVELLETYLAKLPKSYSVGKTTLEEKIAQIKKVVLM